MPLADYSHHNEEAQRIWWEEEGKHADADREAYFAADSPEMQAADAFAEELGEMDSQALLTMYGDSDYLARWPKAKPLIEWELRERGLFRSHNDGCSGCSNRYCDDCGTGCD